MPVRRAVDPMNTSAPQFSSAAMRALLFGTPLIISPSHDDPMATPATENVGLQSVSSSHCAVIVMRMNRPVAANTVSKMRKLLKRYMALERFCNAQ